MVLFYLYSYLFLKRRNLVVLPRLALNVDSRGSLLLSEQAAGPADVHHHAPPASEYHTTVFCSHLQNLFPMSSTFTALKIKFYFLFFLIQVFLYSPRCLVLTMQIRMASNSQRSTFLCMSARIKGICYQVVVFFFFN